MTKTLVALFVISGINACNQDTKEITRDVSQHDMDSKIENAQNEANIADSKSTGSEESVVDSVAGKGTVTDPCVYIDDPTQSDPTQSAAVRSGTVSDPCEEVVGDLLKISEVSYSGSGCNEGSVSVNISDDSQAMTLVFSDFAVELDPSVNRITDTKSCNMLLGLDIPQGYSFSLSYADFRGYAFLESGSEGSLSSRYSFLGDTQTVIFKHSFSSPFDSEFQKRDQLDFETVVWSPCGDGEVKTISLDSRILLEGLEGASSFLSIDSIDNDYSQEYGIEWRKC